MALLMAAGMAQAQVADTGSYLQRMDTDGDGRNDLFLVDFDLDGKVQLAGLQHDVVVGVDDEFRKVYRADLIRGARNTFSYVDPVYGQVEEGTAVSDANSAQTDKLRSKEILHRKRLNTPAGGAVSIDNLDLLHRFAAAFLPLYEQASLKSSQ